MNTREVFEKVTRRADKWEPYFEVYDLYFSRFRNTAPVFVEVGVQAGGSIEAWVNYFENARVYGVDIAPLVTDVPGAEIVIGDQSNPLFWDKFIETVGEIDCFLDDGSHINVDQIITFNSIWPHIKEGGVYMCEDTVTSYWPGFGGGLAKSGTFIEYAKTLVDYMHQEHTSEKLSEYYKDLSRDIRQVSFFNGQVVFVKGRSSFTRVIFND